MFGSIDLSETAVLMTDPDQPNAASTDFSSVIVPFRLIHPLSRTRNDS